MRLFAKALAVIALCVLVGLVGLAGCGSGGGQQTRAVKVIVDWLAPSGGPNDPSRAKSLRFVIHDAAASGNGDVVQVVANVPQPLPTTVTYDGDTLALPGTYSADIVFTDGPDGTGHILGSVTYDVGIGAQAQVTTFHLSDRNPYLL